MEIYIKYFNDLKKELSYQDLDTVMLSESWKNAMQAIADSFNSISASGSESDVATHIDVVLMEFSHLVLEPNGYPSFNLRKEKTVNLEKKVYSAKGRIDSKYSSVVIEYKRQEKYKTSSDTESALQQILDYLNALYIASENKGKFLGFVTDGTKGQFVRFDDLNKKEFDESWEKVAPITSVKNLDSEMVDYLVKSLINLQIKELTSENLIHDLVDNKIDGKNLIYHLTTSLYQSLTTMDPITSASYGQWMNNFGLSHDDASKQKAIEDRRKDLASIINRRKIETDEEYKILFSLQTAVSILAMLIAYRVVVLVKKKENSSFKDLAEMSMDELRIELRKIAEGLLSEELNVFNLLELGCFSWPFRSEYWSETTYNYINKMIEVLMPYEVMPDLTNNTDDLFRDLYMSIMPVSVRHSLGEYYTPAWLAENVIESGLSFIPSNKKNIRVIDSTAGSGTFIQKVIEKKRRKYSSLPKKDTLNFILDEVVAIDANTISVILARINYFLAIADLVSPSDEIFIPVFISDSSIPSRNKKSADSNYYISSVQVSGGNDIRVKVPSEITEDRKKFVSDMKSLSYFTSEDDEALKKQLNKICPNEIELNEIEGSWIELKNKGLITSAIINSLINDFFLCNIGKFDLVVGNPPWVDWKSLPSVHRENKKKICYERKLFSGDGRTGGNSLNICALISNITAENWLKDDGIMSILMPQSLLFQQSYEGYRRFELYDGRRLYFQKIIDWSHAGHPFYPVQQLFCTYIISSRIQNYKEGIPLEKIFLKKKLKLEIIKNKINKITFNNFFDIIDGVVGKASSKRSAFTYAKNKKELREFFAITGNPDYIGREGVEYYPQELQLLKLNTINDDGTVTLTNYQGKKSKIQVGKQEVRLETELLRPLVKGVNVHKFHVDPSEYIVAFPYDKSHDQIPFDKSTLTTKALRLLRYYESNKEYLTIQNKYSDRIIGDKKAPYYSLARTGKYCHADWYVVYRDNTKWGAAVIGKIDTEWGGLKRPAFQNHCVSICERIDGNFISEDEAYYVCAILNSHIVEDYILSTSDKRTFKIRIPVRIEKYNPSKKVHLELVALSKKAHKVYDDKNEVENLRNKIDELYIKSLN